jgi:membrane-bound lytic murein transglycosylase B
VEEMLAAALERKAKTLLERLCDQHAAKRQKGQLRALQPRVSRWQALHGRQVAALEQAYRPASPQAKVAHRDRRHPPGTAVEASADPPCLRLRELGVGPRRSA